MKRTIKVLTLLLASFMWMPLVGPEVQANEAPLPANQAPVLSHEADKTSDASQVHSQTLPLPESKTQPNLDVSTNTPAKEEGTSGTDLKEAVDQPKGPANKVPETDSSKEKDSSGKGGETDPLKQLSDKPSKEEANQSSDKPSKEEANQSANKPTKEGANQPADKPTNEEGNQPAKEEATESAAAAQVESKQIMNLMNANASAKKINEPIAKETDIVIKEVSVDSLEDLQKAIDNATDDELTRIVLNKSIDVTQRIDVPKGKRIILTANNQKLADGPWQKIEQPADYAEEGEAKQREIIEEARKRVEQVRDLVDLDKNPLPDPSQEISLKRSDQFLTDSLFAVRGLLQIGDQNSSLKVDGNKTVKTVVEKKGVLFDVRGERSKLFLKNGTLINVNNTKGYAAPIYVGDHAAFEMDGGRITHNKVKWSNTYPAAPGAIYG